MFWFPLGYAMNVLHNPSLMTPPSSRPLLWAWTGSTIGRAGGLSVFLCNWSNTLQFNACNWTINACNSMTQARMGNTLSENILQTSKHINRSTQGQHHPPTKGRILRSASLKCVSSCIMPHLPLSAGKKDRLQMIEALKGAPDLMERGFLDSFEHFNLGGLATPNSYTALLYNSSIVPCPRGMPALRKPCSILHNTGAALLRCPFGESVIERSHFIIISRAVICELQSISPGKMYVL